MDRLNALCKNTLLIADVQADEASAAVVSGFTVVLAVIMTQSARAMDLQGGMPNTTARYAFIGFIVLSLVINAGAFGFAAHYFGQAKSAVSACVQGTERELNRTYHQLSRNAGLGVWGSAFYFSLFTWICALLGGWHQCCH